MKIKKNPTSLILKIKKEIIKDNKWVIYKGSQKMNSLLEEQ